MYPYALLTLIAIKVTWLVGFIIPYGIMYEVSRNIVSLIITTGLFDIFKNAILWSANKNKESKTEKYFVTIICFWMIGAIPFIMAIFSMTEPMAKYSDVIVAGNLAGLYIFDVVFYYVCSYIFQNVTHVMFKRYLQEDNKCAICMFNDASISGDCGHVCMCDNCQVDINQCPLCRHTYESKYRVITIGANV